MTDETRPRTLSDAIRRGAELVNYNQCYVGFFGYTRGQREPTSACALGCARLGAGGCGMRDLEVWYPILSQKVVKGQRLQEAIVYWNDVLRMPLAEIADRVAAIEAQQPPSTPGEAVHGACATAKAAPRWG